MRITHNSLSDGMIKTFTVVVASCDYNSHEMTVVGKTCVYLYKHQSRTKL